MKFYQQEGLKLNRSHLAESDHICTCCQSYDHAAATYHPDDIECPDCGALCCCDCHRQKNPNAKRVTRPEA
jgi:hypothetical protein